MKFIYSDKSFHIVSGNCDGFSDYKTVGEITLNSKRIMYTHGHIYDVKRGMQKLNETARILKADLVLYGHTHLAKTEYANGIYFVNPGSISLGSDGSVSYSIVDLDIKGIMPSIIYM